MKNSVERKKKNKSYFYNRRFPSFLFISDSDLTWTLWLFLDLSINSIRFDLINVIAIKLNGHHVCNHIADNFLLQLQTNDSAKNNIFISFIQIIFPSESGTTQNKWRIFFLSIWLIAAIAWHCFSILNCISNFCRAKK